MKSTPRIILTMMLCLVLTGCTGAAAEPSDQPFGTYEKTVEEYDVGSFAVPVFREDEGLTYINDILIVNEEYDLPPDYNPGLETEVIEAAEQLMQDAADEGFSLTIVSGFRSYQDQEAVYEDFVDRLGQEEAEQYTNLPGHSEHQTGLAIDIGTVESASTAAVSFGDTEAYAWMKDVAHEYGFIVRYQEGKEDITGMSYEPWHLRYVGVEAATEMYEEDLVLEEYLGID